MVYSDIIAFIVYGAEPITPTKTGYSLYGWLPDTGKLVDGDAELAATWAEHQVTIVFDPDFDTPMR